MANIGRLDGMFNGRCSGVNKHDVLENPPLIVDVPLATKHVLRRKTSSLGLIQSAMFAATGEFYLIYPKNQPFQAPWLSCLCCLGRLSGKTGNKFVVAWSLHIFLFLYIYIHICVCMFMYVYIYNYIHIYICCIYYIHNWIFKGAHFSARSAFWLVSRMFVHLTKKHPFRTVVQTAKCPVSTGLISLWHCNFM